MPKVLGVDPKEMFERVASYVQMDFGLDAPAVIEIVEGILDTLGNEAFGGSSIRAQLYSGPHSPQSITTSNKDRALRQAQASGAVVLDTTPIGKFLDNFGEPRQTIYDYFLAQQHRSKQPLSHDEAITAADQVMGFVSDRFIKRLKGSVYTAVCGASQSRFFCAYEMRRLLEKPYPPQGITDINGIPVNKIRVLYEWNEDPYDDLQPRKEERASLALRLICLGELKMALARFRKKMTIDNYHDFAERMELYWATPWLQPLHEKGYLRKEEKEMLVTERALFRARSQEGKRVDFLVSLLSPASVLELSQT